MVNNKSLFKNSIYNVLYKMLNVVFPLISSSYIAHVLLANGSGKIASAQNVVQYFVLIAALGIPNYGTREIAKVRDVILKRQAVFSELFFINMVSTIFCTLCFYSFICLSHIFDNERVLYCVTGVHIVLNVINIDWFYQGIEEYKYIAIRSFVIKILSLLALFLFVRKTDDYVVYAIIYNLAIAGNYVFNFVHLKKFNTSVKSPDKLSIARHLKPVFILLCTTVAIELYTLLDTTMITCLCDSENVAYYTNSIKIVRILISLVSAIGGVLLPRLSYYRENNNIEECSGIVTSVFHILYFIFLPCCLGLFLCAQYIVPVLYGNSFLPSIITLRIASLLILALGFSNLFGTQVLLTFDNEKALLLCTIVGAITNISLNAFLIPAFQQNGAIIASVISEMLVTIMSYIYARKYIRIKWDLKTIFNTVLASIVMSIGVLIVKYFFSNPYIALCVSIIVGALIYMITNYFLKTPVLYKLNSIIGKKK